MDYDVIIIGGGPCGLIAARDIAKKGANVCVVEKSPEIGYPVKCSGLFSVAGLTQLGLDVSDSLICSTIRGGRFYSPRGEDFLAYSKHDRAVVVERKMFDKELAKDAVRAGAEILLKTTALGMKRNGRVRVRINEVGVEKTISSKLLIGADGAGSQVAKWTGINRENKFVSGVQVEVVAADIEEDIAEVYFGKLFAPGFYGWILPKGDVFEVGVGSTGGSGETPRVLLNRFMTEHPVASKKIDSKSILEFNTGAIPVGGPLETVSENIMLVGDAAGQTKASTGGGVITGGICARIAADAAISAIEDDNYSREFLLETYDKSWRVELEEELMAHLFLKGIIDSATDSELDGLFALLKNEGVPELMTTYTDTDRPLDFVKEVLKKDAILNWAQGFLDIRKEFLG
jgi:geranylgeranyl reductase family protein